jgi:hypothetical protein
MADTTPAPPWSWLVVAPVYRARDDLVMADTVPAPPWSWLVAAPGTDGCPSASPWCECHRGPVLHEEPDLVRVLRESTSW